jgi:hypothetical protein
MDREQPHSHPLAQPRARAPLGVKGKPFVARFLSTSSTGTDVPQLGATLARRQVGMRAKVRDDPKA